MCVNLGLSCFLQCKYVLNCRLVWMLNCMLINTPYGPQRPSGVRPKQSSGHIDVVPKQNKTKTPETWSELSSTIYFFNNQILQTHLQTQALSALVTGFDLTWVRVLRSNHNIHASAEWKGKCWLKNWETSKKWVEDQMRTKQFSKLSGHRFCSCTISKLKYKSLKISVQTQRLPDRFLHSKLWDIVRLKTTKPIFV